MKTWLAYVQFQNNITEQVSINASSYNAANQMLKSQYSSAKLIYGLRPAK